MKIENIKTPEDILEFMKSNIKYGWLDINNEEHIGNMKGFRSLYRISSLEETLNHKIGTCIEQVYLMKSLLDKINIPNKMFCTRIYEGEDFNDLDPLGEPTDNFVFNLIGVPCVRIFRKNKTKILSRSII